MTRSPARAVAAPAVLALALLASACATTSGSKPAGTAHAEAPRGRSGDMVSGEESGLGVTGAETPPALRTVAAAPYALPTAVDCAALDREIAGLDELLGPDVDMLADPKAGAGLEDRAGQAFGSVLRGAIPYRWALRWMTGAADQDRKLRQAIMAGAARRGFLKGLRLAMACPVQTPPPPGPKAPAPLAERRAPPPPR
jgi:hypothetical protein